MIPGFLQSTTRRWASFALLILGAPAALAQLTPSGGYHASEMYAVSDGLLSAFTIGSDNNLYYMKSGASYMGTSFLRWDGSTTTTLYNAPMEFAGAGVTAVNDWIYFNSSDFSNIQYIHGHQAGSGSTSVVSTNFNHGLFQAAGVHPNTLWLTGAQQPTYQTEILYAQTDASGCLIGSFATIAQPGGASGPMAFDTSGNLFYANGFATEFYAWSATQVSAALLDPTNNMLTTGNAQLVHNYGSDFTDQVGATGMTFDESGMLYLTLTNFSGPSILASFLLDDFDVENSFATAESTGRLGTLIFHDGQLLVGTENGIYSLAPIPEPSALFLLGVILLAGILIRERRGSI